jgi:hypothetical protein
MVDEAQIRNLLEAGESINSIRRKLPVGKCRVRRIRSEMGLPAQRNAPVTPTHCPRGHSLAEHLGRTDEGWLYCAACRDPLAGDVQHRGHVVISTRGQGPLCITCRRGDHDLDEMAVERTVWGDRPQRLTIAERERAALVLRDRGVSAGEVAELLRCTPRTVYRIYARQRLALAVETAA